jgi:hypothetical protein
MGRVSARKGRQFRKAGDESRAMCLFVGMGSQIEAFTDAAVFALKINEPN